MWHCGGYYEVHFFKQYSTCQGPRVSVLSVLLAHHEQADLLQLRHQGRPGAPVPEPQQEAGSFHGWEED